MLCSISLLMTTITIMSNSEPKNIKQELPCNLNQSFNPLSVLTATSAPSYYAGTASQPLPSLLSFMYGIPWDPIKCLLLVGAINSCSEDKRILLALVVQHSLYLSLIFSIGSSNSFRSMYDALPSMIQQLKCSSKLTASLEWSYPTFY